MSTPTPNFATPSLRTEIPPPKTTLVIDIDFTLNCGREYSFTLRPDLGDTISLDHQFLELKFARTNHEVQVQRAQIAVLAKVQRQLVIELAHPAAGPMFAAPTAPTP